MKLKLILNRHYFFLSIRKNFIMDNLRRGENRKGQPHNNRAGKNREQAPVGFEGMNYEQKRRPYNETDRLYKDWDRNVENNSKSGRRHDNR